MKQKILLRATGAALLSAVIYLAVFVVFQQFPIGGGRFISEEYFPQEIPAIVGHVVREFEVPLLEVYGAKNPVGTDDVNMIQYNSLLVFANGRIVSGGKTYECFLPLYRIPFTKQYFYRTGNYAIAEEGSLTGFYGFPFYLGRMYITLDGENGLAFDSMEANYGIVLCAFIIGTGGFVGQYRRDKKKYLSGKSDEQAKH